VDSVAAQRLWHSTLDLMAGEPGANHAELDAIRTWITTGVTLDILRPPARAFLENTSTVRQNAGIVRSRIQQYIEFEAIVPLPADHPLPFGTQPLHVIIKDGKKPRLVIDLSQNLNDMLQHVPFSYSTVRDAVALSSPECWYGKLDLSNCFLSFPLHPSALPHFIFRFDGQLYQFTRLPFGLSSAPYICTQLLSVVAFRLRCAGIAAHVRYLDDFLLIETSRADSQRALDIAQASITAFGLVVNPDKTEGPAQRLAFLGVQLDSAAQTLACTPERVTELLTLLRAAAHGIHIRLSELDTLVGKLQFAAQVLPGFRPFTRRMIDLGSQRRCSVERRARGNNRRLHFALRNAWVRTDDGFRADVGFWRSHLQQWNGTQRWRSEQSAPFVFVSDASLGGFGFYLESAPPAVDTAQWPSALRPGSGHLGIYSQLDAPHHLTPSDMTWCELFAVYAAAVTFSAVLHDCCVRFVLDNQSDVHVLNRQATRSRRLAGLLRAIYTFALDHTVDIYAQHRPGAENVLADFLSRPSLRGARTDSESVLRRWQQLHGADPALCARLSCVCVVHSQDIGTWDARPSSTTSVTSATRRTLETHTPARYAC